ncbi:MAG: hypothetical protein IJ460_02930 [Clostridia bacterium]|nr:hypothetical protein [Clostridia bacterium]
MKKQIVLITENENSDYREYSEKVLEKTDFEIICAPADINRYDAVVFVFDKEPYNTNERLNSWVGHSHLRAIWGSSEAEKKAMLKNELTHIAGIPFPLEIERKFLIEYPDTEKLGTMGNCRSVELEQIYLSPIDGAHIRIRRRSAIGEDIYIKTEKKKISAAVRIETEEEISKEQYRAYKLHADSELMPITKTRYCLMDNGRYFEIDIFPFWKDKAYLEIELTDENEKFHLPEFIRVIKEVTEDRSYTNRSLAKLLKSEKINEL